MPNLSNVLEKVKTTAIKRSPELLTGFGITGMIAGTIWAIRATSKALKKIDELKSPTKTEIVKRVWPMYIPTIAIESLSVACFVAANSVNNRRKAALAAAYSLSESALKTYQDKVVETIGKKKEQSIRDEISGEKIKKEPIVNKEVYITGKGETLFFDSISSRYFNCDIEKVRQVVNILNKRMISEMYIPLNEFYYEIGLAPTKIGDDIGWNIQNDLIDISFSAQLSEDGRPCIVLDYLVEPRYEYRSVY